MEILELFCLFSHNFLSPAIMFFILGIIAGLLKSNLDIPGSISKYFSLYLIIAIGFKGGVAISEINNVNYELLLTIFTGLGICFLQPFLCYYLLKTTTKVDIPTAAVIAANYSSVSIVTFITTTDFLSNNKICYDGYIVALVALMEVPAIISSLFIAQYMSQKSVHLNGSDIIKINTKAISQQILSNEAILLLCGTFIIGWISGASGLSTLEGFLISPFQGMLALFLLDTGLTVSRQLHHTKEFSIRLILFAIYMPLIGASIGLISSKIIGLDLGTGVLFTVLCASASYIAVPATMRVALPQAKIAIYIPMSLAITFPFNIVIGIPIYFTVARILLN